MRGLTLQQSWARHEALWGLGHIELKYQGLDGYNCRLTAFYRVQTRIDRGIVDGSGRDTRKEWNTRVTVTAVLLLSRLETASADSKGS